MSRLLPLPVNPDLDLEFERIVPLPPKAIWDAWTKPAQLVKWFTPAPWKTIECAIDLRPGGRFYTVMQSPEGQLFPGEGCYLEVVPNRRLIWTNAMAPGFRPVPPPSAADENVNFTFTGVITLTPHGKGTKYHAHVRHSNIAGRNAHAAMNFAEGWGKALDQLVAMVNARRAPKPRRRAAKAKPKAKPKAKK